MATKTKQQKTKKTKKTKSQKTSEKNTKTKEEKAEEVARLRSGRLSAKSLTCLCGCGEKTATDGARFLTGHDARLKGRLTRLYEDRPLDEDEIPEIALPFLAEEDGLCGFRMYKKTANSKSFTIEKIGDEE